MITTSAIRLGMSLKLLATNRLAKVAQIFGDILAIFKDITFKVEPTFWVTRTADLNHWRI